MNKNKKKLKISGFTMIELLLAAGFIGIGASFAYSQIVLMKRSLAKSQLRRELSDLRQAIALSTNCDETLKNFINDDGSITCSGVITLKDFEGHAIANPMGNFDIRTTCANTGLTVTIASNANRIDPMTKSKLDYSNTNLNPFFGRGSAYGLCENSFKNTRRVLAYKVPQHPNPDPNKATLHYTDAECTTIKASHPDPTPKVLPLSAYQTKMASLSAPFNLATTLSNRCRDYCTASPRFYVSGYLADCSNTEATCVCFR